MPKLTQSEYIVKAAKLYGLTDIEIDALKDHLDGKFENPFIVRRCDFLFRLYDIYNSKEYNEKIDPDEDGLINLNDYAFEISKRRLADSKIGEFWIISSNLEAYLATVPANVSDEIQSEYFNISEKNNFLIPQLAKQIGIDATIYYKGELINNYDELKKYHLTKNFLQQGETLIRGKFFVRDNPNRMMVDFENVLEDTDRYVRRQYKKHKFSQAETDQTRKEIREGLIKQTLFSKMVFNENESNEKWGLIEKSDGRLKLAPMFSYDFCANVQTSIPTKHRVVQTNKEYIEDFILEYSSEPWFKKWIEDVVLNLNLEKAVADMERRTGVTLTEEETKYYNFVIMENMHSKIANVSDLNYDENLVIQERKSNSTFGERITRARRIIHDKRSDISYTLNKKFSNRNQRDDR